MVKSKALHPEEFEDEESQDQLLLLKKKTPKQMKASKATVKKHPKPEKSLSAEAEKESEDDAGYGSKDSEEDPSSARKIRHVSKACSNCQKGHVACDHSRPCK